MSTQLKFSVKNVLNHLEHSVLNFFFVFRALNVSSYFTQIVFLHFIFSPEEKLASPCSVSDILIHIDTNEHPNFLYTVQERSQREVARCSEKTNYCVKVLNLWVMFKYTLKFFHQRVTISISEKFGAHISANIINETPVQCQKADQNLYA